MCGMARLAHPLLQTLGLTIRSLRRERGLSQEALADLAQIDRSYMSSVERGLRNISVLNIARIAKALDVPVRDLLGPREVVRTTAAIPVPPRRPAISDMLEADWKPGRYLSLC
jgi:transcriptional regulator with XRE-family HTH domain